jgi:ring-1,2-phenylacetyl-CoA epoxidase subunit PaaD
MPVLHATDGAMFPDGASPPSVGALWDVLDTVPDPEIPAVSVVELGILRGIEWDATDAATLVVTVTPTYSGCPATEVIMASIEDALKAAGVARVRIETRLVPAWTTGWMTPEAKRKLTAYGIAPPDGMSAPGRPKRELLPLGGMARSAKGATMGAVSPTTPIDVAGISPLRRGGAVACPRCESRRTQLVSQFGSTACKAHYRCLECLEPFDYFKPH